MLFWKGVTFFNTGGVFLFTWGGKKAVNKNTKYKRARRTIKLPKNKGLTLSLVTRIKKARRKDNYWKSKIFIQIPFRTFAFIEKI